MGYYERAARILRFLGLGDASRQALGDLLRTMDREEVTQGMAEVAVDAWSNRSAPATSGWEATNDLDRMLAEAKDFTPWSPDTSDAAKVDRLIDLVLSGDQPGDATYSVKLDAGFDVEHDYTTGLIEISLAELQTFRAILALRRSGS